MCGGTRVFSSFFFNDTATPEIYTLSLHDALPISAAACRATMRSPYRSVWTILASPYACPDAARKRRSEEHTSELQSRQYLVCRLLLEKKKKNMTKTCNNNNKMNTNRH